MKIAITGGTGFVGGHLARALAAQGHDVVLVSRRAKKEGASQFPPGTTFAHIGLDDEEALATAFAGCDAVAHCAGINREIGTQTYENVHVQGTRHVVNAAQRAGVKKIVFLSFLRARPDCGSAYHESKWAGEEMIRASGLDYTVLKPGVIYGRGDHMLDHLSHAFFTFPIFALVGLKDQLVRPLAVADMVQILEAALLTNELSRKTISITGPEEMTLRQAVERVALVVGKRPFMFHMPLWFHYAFAWAIERFMVVPLVSVGQVRILSEGVVEALPRCETLPSHLLPQIDFNTEQIRRGLPPPKPFGMADIRCCAAH